MFNEKTRPDEIVYTDYLFDARVRREAEILALFDEFDVTVIVPKQKNVSLNVAIDGVHLIKVKEKNTPVKIY